MPNWVTNWLRISGDQDHIRQIIADATDPTIDLRRHQSQLDFTRLRPFPEEFQYTGSPPKIVTQAEYDAALKELQEALAHTHDLPEAYAAYLSQQCAYREAFAARDNGSVNEVVAAAIFDQVDLSFEEWREHEIARRCSRLLPMPITQEMSDDYKRRFGTDDSHEWQKMNWGTNVGPRDPHSVHCDEDAGFCCCFDTSWAPCDRLWQYVSAQYPGVKIENSYREENNWGGLDVFLEGALKCHEYFEKPDDQEPTWVYDIHFGGDQDAVGRLLRDGNGERGFHLEKLAESEQRTHRHADGWGMPTTIEALDLNPKSEGIFAAFRVDVFNSDISELLRAIAQKYPGVEITARWHSPARFLFSVVTFQNDDSSEAETGA
jgi:hypothetical protein